MIFNRVVLDATQKAQTSVTFTADVQNGGGRPTHNLDGTPRAFSTQTDSAFIRVRLYDNAGTLLNTVTSPTYTLRNLGSDPSNGFSTKPGDNQHPWTLASVTYTGDLSNVRFVQLEMVGTDGAYWAGNYGPMWRVPTVTFGSDPTNTVYNPEFGVAPNSVRAQGWFNSSNSWAVCGVTSGNVPCVTAVSGVNANMWGGGYDINGGSLAGQAGGYDGTLTSSSADQAAATGSPAPSSPPPPPPPPTPVYSSGITAGQQSRKTNNLNENPLGHNTHVDILGDDNIVNIQQIGGRHFVAVDIQGNINNVEILQTSTVNARHYMEARVTGSNNDLILQQRDTSKTQFVEVMGNNNTITSNQKGTGNHYLDIKVTGDSHTAGIIQDGSGNHRATVHLSGSQPWNFNLNQNSSTSQTYSLPHGMSDGSAVSGTCAAIGGCNLTITQQ